MGLDKSELKRATAHEIGNALEDVLEQCRIAQARKAGEADAWAAAAASVEGLLSHVNREVDEGKLDLEQAKLAKTWLLRAVNGAKAAAVQKRTEAHVAVGKTEALTAAVAVTKRVYDREDAKAQAISKKDVIDIEDRRRGRTVGVRPEAGVKQRRLAEDKPKPVKKRGTKGTKKGAKKSSIEVVSKPSETSTNANDS